MCTRQSSVKWRQDRWQATALRFVRWFDVRADKFRTKKGWVKMHAIVDIRTRVIIDYLVTDSVARHKRAVRDAA